MQQLIHFIDRAAWALGDEPPLKAWGIGGRSACFGESYGDLFDHQAIVDEYAGGGRVYAVCRNQAGCQHETTSTIFGTKGTAHMSRHGVSVGRIEGQTHWQCKRPRPYSCKKMASGGRQAPDFIERNGCPAIAATCRIW